MVTNHNFYSSILLGISGNFEIIGKNTQINDLIAIDWHMSVSSKPLLYAISISKNDFGAELIRNAHVFTINFMPKNYDKEILFCKENSGIKIDKYKSLNLTKVPCESIEGNYIKEAKLVYECEVFNEIDSGDHILFIGKIINSRKN